MHRHIWSNVTSAIALSACLVCFRGMADASGSGVGGGGGGDDPAASAAAGDGAANNGAGAGAGSDVPAESRRKRYILGLFLLLGVVLLWVASSSMIQVRALMLLSRCGCSTPPRF